MSKVVTTLKDCFAWQADLVERHPRLALGGIWVLAVLAIAF